VTSSTSRSRMPSSSNVQGVKDIPGSSAQNYATSQPVARSASSSSSNYSSSRILDAPEGEQEEDEVLKNDAEESQRAKGPEEDAENEDQIGTPKGYDGLAAGKWGVPSTKSAAVSMQTTSKTPASAEPALQNRDETVYSPEAAATLRQPLLGHLEIDLTGTGLEEAQVEGVDVRPKHHAHHDEDEHDEHGEYDYQLDVGDRNAEGRHEAILSPSHSRESTSSSSTALFPLQNHSAAISPAKIPSSSVSSAEKSLITSPASGYTRQKSSTIVQNPNRAVQPVSLAQQLQALNFGDAKQDQAQHYDALSQNGYATDEESLPTSEAYDGESAQSADDEEEQPVPQQP